VSEVVTLVLAVGFVIVGFVLAVSVIRESGESMGEQDAGTAPGDARSAGHTGTRPAGSPGRPLDPARLGGDEDVRV
jgi:hypothetical protein